MKQTLPEKAIFIDNNLNYINRISGIILSKLNISQKPVIISTKNELQKYCQENKMEINNLFIVNMHFKPGRDGVCLSSNLGLIDILWWLRQQGNIKSNSIYWCPVILYSFWSKNHIINNLKGRILTLNKNHGYILLPASVKEWEDTVENTVSQGIPNAQYRQHIKDYTNVKGIARQLLNHDMLGLLLRWDGTENHLKIIKEELLEQLEQLYLLIGHLKSKELSLLLNEIENIDPSTLKRIVSDCRSMARDL